MSMSGPKPDDKEKKLELKDQVADLDPVFQGSMITLVDPKYFHAFSLSAWDYNMELAHYHLYGNVDDKSISCIVRLAFSAITDINPEYEGLTMSVRALNLRSAYKSIIEKDSIKNKVEILDQIAKIEIEQENITAITERPLHTIKHYIYLLKSAKKHIKNENEYLLLEEFFLKKILAIGIIKNKSIENLYLLKDHLRTPSSRILNLFLSLIEKNTFFDLPKEVEYLTYKKPKEVWSWFGNILGEFVDTKQIASEFIPIPDLVDIMLAFNGDNPTKMGTYPELMLKKINDPNEKPFIQFIYEWCYNKEPYTSANPFNRILEKIDIKEILSQLKKQDNSQFAQYILAYAATKNIKNYTDYIDFLKERLKNAELDTEVKLNERTLSALFGGLPMKDNKPQVTQKDIFIALFKNFDEKQACQFSGKLDFLNMDATTFIALLRIFKDLDPLIRIALIKQLFNTVSADIIHSKLAKLPRDEIKSLLSLYQNYTKGMNQHQHEPLIKELDEYILKTTNPLRVIQAYQAKWIIAYPDKKSENPNISPTNPLINLIRAVQTSHDSYREKYSILGTSSNLVKILIRAKETMEEPPVPQPQNIRSRFTSLFKTTNDKAYELTKTTKTNKNNS